MPKRYSFVALLPLILMLAACGGAPSAPTNTPSNSESQLKAAATLQFGAVAVGGTRSSSVAMSNTAQDGRAIIISEIDVIGTGFRLGNIPALPFALPAGGSVVLGIEFSPLRPGSARGTVSIVSDANNSLLPVALSGSGNAGGEITVSPVALNFGSVGVGSSTTLNGTLTASNSDVTISTVDQSGQGYSLSGISFPLTLAAGQSVPFTVTFAPQASGASNGTIAFVTSSGSPSATLTGAGAQSSSSHNVELSWNPSTSPVVGYNIYRGLQSGGPYTKLTGSPQATTSFADTTVQSGATYFYVATSVTSNSQESAYSNQTVASVP